MHDEYEGKENGNNDNVGAVNLGYGIGIWAVRLEFGSRGPLREGDWKMDLRARILALRLETGRWGKLEKEKEASRPRRTQ